jgi:hypothetical protein
MILIRERNSVLDCVRGAGVSASCGTRASASLTAQLSYCCCVLVFEIKKGVVGLFAFSE